MRNRVLIAAVLSSIAVPAISFGQVIFTDNFSNATDPNFTTYVVNTSGGTPASDATFGYDYSQLGIPAAPHTTDTNSSTGALTTLGLRTRVEDLGNAAAGVGAIEAVTQGLAIPSQFTLTVDVWGNYIGGNTTGTGLASSGSNGSNAAGIGIGTSGKQLQSPNANDGYIVDSFHDGGGAPDYRIYANSARQSASNTTYFAAGESSTGDSHSNSYYSFLGSHTAPAAQTAVGSPNSTQQGSTPVGIIGFTWTTWTLTDDGTNITWSIDNDAAINPVTKVIATIPVSAMTFGGNQVSLSTFDSSTGGNSTANGQLFNADIWDNLTITALPEPTSIAMLGLGALSLLARRRK